MVYQDETEDWKEVRRNESMRFFREMKKYWKFAKYAAKADLRAEVANSYLNWLWWIIEPLSSMLVYTIVFGIVFKTQEKYFPVFVFIAVTVWDYFSRCMSSSVNLIRDNQHIISRVYMPKYILLVQRMLVLFFKMLIGWSLVALMLIAFRVPIGVNLIFFLPTLVVFFTFCFACGLFLLHFGTYVSDLSNLVTIALNLLFYATGIFYNIQQQVPAPYGYFFQRVNPVAYLIFCFRKAILNNERPSCIMLGIWFVISLALVAGGLQLIYKNENNYAKIV